MRAPLLQFRLLMSVICLSLGLAGTPLLAETAPSIPSPAMTFPVLPHDNAPNGPRTDGLQPGYGLLRLSATLTADLPLVKSGIQWRVFDQQTDADGNHKLVGQSSEAQPVFSLPDGHYIVNVN